LNKIVIFGVGLIGGSVALALKKKNIALKIVGVGRNAENLQMALALGVIDEVGSNIPKALADADLVMIATPVAQTPMILETIIPHLSEKTIITDAGSTKSDIAKYVQSASKFAKNPEKFLSQFVGGHPVAGAEKSGVSAANADLFIGKNIVLTPDQHTSENAINVVRNLWLTTGANVSEMSALAHDQIFAAVSHLPHLLAFALVNDLAKRPNAKQLFDFAASGFRDFTRIAGSSPEMWRDISLANKNALLDELETYQAEISALQQLLKNEDTRGLLSMFEHASQARQTWQKGRENS
jgi:prephenate dehydrogenase